MIFMISDEQLVENFVAGDESSFEILCRRYDRLIKSLSRTFVLLTGSVEDLWQEGFLGLLSACRTYDGSKENASSFKTYAYSCIRNKMLMSVKSQEADKHKPLTNYVSIDDNLQFGGSDISPEDAIIDSEYINEIKGRIMSVLSPFEKKVFELYIEGYNYLEIAKKLSKPAKSIDNALQRIKEKSRQ